jgi:molybdate transport system regulatory protein
MNDRLEPRIRILLGSSIAIGPGKAALLEAIGETGSIAAAGRRMGMNYRRAWLLANSSAHRRQGLAARHRTPSRTTFSRR